MNENSPINSNRWIVTLAAIAATGLAAIGAGCAPAELGGGYARSARTDGDGRGGPGIRLLDGGVAPAPGRGDDEKFPGSPTTTDPNGGGGTIAPLPDAGTPDPGSQVTPYPSGPYGSRRGEVFEDHSFTNSDDTPYRWSDVRNDPDAKVILWVVSAEWCGACRQQVPHLNQLHRDNYDRGLRVVEALTEDNYSSPASADTAQRWKSDLGCDFDVVADPSPNIRVYVTPSAWVLDAETMEVIQTFEGDERSIDRVVDEALSNSSR